MKRGHGFFVRNNVIVLLNIATACVLLFCLFYFFFANMNMFLKDLTSFMFFAPIILFLGMLFICYYITMLVFYLFESRTVWLADRFDLPYKIVFAVTMLMLTIRSFLGDFMCTEYWCADNPCDNPNNCSIHRYDFFDTAMACHNTMLNVPVAIIVFAIISGIVTWCIPKIKDNDNNEF